MGKSKKLAGIPWHTELLHMQEGDERRDKRRCKYYYVSKYTGEGRCLKCSIKCPGSSHCGTYSEKVDNR